jgi:hypothetical protein
VCERERATCEFVIEDIQKQKNNFYFVDENIFEHKRKEEEKKSL